jgi:hypothetical protein
MPAVLSGVNFITCGGTLDSTMLESPLLLALDDEICGMLLRIGSGIAVDDEYVVRWTSSAGSISPATTWPSNTRAATVREH